MNLLGAIAQAGVAGEAARAGGYRIQRSLRFNSADSAYLSRTPASAGNRRTFTFSCWVKRSALIGDTQTILNSKDDATAAANTFAIRFTSAEALIISNYASGYILNLTTTQVFRDISAWGHLVVAIDTTQATSSNTVKIYWNGVQITAFGTAIYPSQNTDLNWNVSSQDINIGRYGVGAGGSNYFNGYLTEFYLIDGQQLTPSSFGETNATTGVWSPIRYTGSYGTNGFYLNFSDNSNTTAATLGADSSGNGNNWTPNNFSVAAGAGNDSLVDTPTQYGDDTGAGGEVRGNYCTLNPLFKSKDGGTTSNGNLNYAGTRAAWDIVCGTIGMTSGKWYWEVSANQSTYCMAGITSSLVTLESNYFNSGDTYGYNADLGTKYSGNIGTNQAYGASWNGLNDICGVAFDADNMELTFYKNGVSQGVAYTTANFPTDGRAFFPAVTCYDTSTATFNFGQRPFAYTPPSGFKALCTTNLSEPTILEGDQHFNTVLYTGNGTTNHAITGFGFQPDWVWQKSRNQINNNHLTDAVRGVNKDLLTNSTTEELTYTDGVTSFDADGFTVGNQSSEMNASGITYAVWGWKANGSGSTNTDGSITSTVSANQTAGISIVTYTGTGSNATVGHGLGATPSMIIVKSRSQGTTNYTANWYMYHVGLSASEPQNWRIQLNLTQNSDRDTAIWGSTAPTSSVFSVGSYNNVNYSGHNFVAYCFAPISGFSAFGSYTGNASTNGPFIYTGFRPEFILIKGSAIVSNWQMLDATRNPYNAAQNFLRANSNIAEATNYPVDFLSNGFKLRNTDSDYQDASTYIYAAFAENPFKYSLAR